MQKENVFVKKVWTSLHRSSTMLSLASLLLLGSLTSCKPTVVETPTPNALVSTPDTLKLPKSLDTTLYSNMGLECGCPFDFTVTGAGDTSKIKWVVPTSSATITQYLIGAYAVKSLPSGSYSSWISFQTRNEDPTGPTYFYDTLHATITVP
jgi:hypothetical protein